MVPSVSAPTAVRQNMPAELLSVKNLENPSQHKHLIWVSNWTEAGLTRLCTTWNGSADTGMADGFAEAKKASSLCLQHSCGSIISKSFGVVKKPRTPVLFQALLLIQIFGQQSTVQEQSECNQKKKKGTTGKVQFLQFRKLLDIPAVVNCLVSLECYSDYDFLFATTFSFSFHPRLLQYLCLIFNFSFLKFC